MSSVILIATDPVYGTNYGTLILSSPFPFLLKGKHFQKAFFEGANYFYLPGEQWKERGGEFAKGEPE